MTDNSDVPRPRIVSVFLCYITVIAVQLLVGVILALILIILGWNIQNSSIPLGVILTPISAISIGIVTLFFAKRQGMDFKELGIKKLSLSQFFIAILIGIGLVALASAVETFQTLLFGPNPDEGVMIGILLPNDFLQTIIMITSFILLVGPMEEIFARGFIQKGLNNHFGSVKGWLIASFLFALLHITNSLYSFIPVLIGGGLAIGYIWQKTGENTTFTWIIHSTYDSILIIAIFFFR